MDDLIRREEAKAAIRKMFLSLADRVEINSVLNDLPSVSTKKTGRWIKIIGENGVTSATRCSECGFEYKRYVLFNYCPNCGAKMEVEANELCKRT